MNGVSIIIPAYNAERTIEECLSAATKLEWSGNLEVIVVDDGSTDRTAIIASAFPKVQLISVPNGGASRATNIGIQAAHYDIVVSLDADAILEKDWLNKIISSFNEPNVAAVAGYALTGNRSLVGKLMGYDVELRLDRTSIYTDHLYSMNTAYRRSALVKVGMFDEGIKIGYDVDISRRLKASGYRLVLRKDAICTHYWRDDLRGYLRQQYSYAYYRLEITRRFKKAHDQVAGIGMILNVPVTAIVLLFGILGTIMCPFAPLLLLLLPAIHLPEMFTLLFKKREACVLALPFLFTLRNFAWIRAAVVWVLRQGLNKLRMKTP